MVAESTACARNLFQEIGFRHGLDIQGTKDQNAQPKTMECRKPVLSDCRAMKDHWLRGVLKPHPTQTKTGGACVEPKEVSGASMDGELLIHPKGYDFWSAMAKSQTQTVSLPNLPESNDLWRFQTPSGQRFSPSKAKKSKTSCESGSKKGLAILPF